MAEQQLTLHFGEGYDDPILEVMAPRDLWERVTQAELSHYKEDRRVEFKSSKVHLDDIAKYFSMYSNTSPEGGLLLVGVDNNGSPTGLSDLSDKQINELEKVHVQRCPGARPEYRRVQCNVGGRADFFVAVFIPYINKLTETNRGEAYVRYGDSIRKMSDDEKRDFRQSRHEIEFELEPCGLTWPSDFDISIIENLCKKYEVREDVVGRSVEEILEIRHLGQRVRGQFQPNKALALLAANDARALFPGCRVRIQRFEGKAEGHGSSYNPIIDRFVEGNVVELIERSSAIINNVIYDFTWLNSDGKFITTK